MSVSPVTELPLIGNYVFKGRMAFVLFGLKSVSSPKKNSPTSDLLAQREISRVLPSLFPLTEWVVGQLSPGGLPVLSFCGGKPVELKESFITAR